MPRLTGGVLLSFRTMHKGSRFIDAEATDTLESALAVFEKIQKVFTDEWMGYLLNVHENENYYKVLCRAKLNVFSL